MQAASYPHIEAMLEGVVLSAPALRVEPAHPIVGVSSYFSSLNSIDCRMIRCLAD